MNESQMKRELYAFYLGDNAARTKGFAEKCFAIPDARVEDGMSVTGFSVRFTSLSKEWQKEILTRNFYD